MSESRSKSLAAIVVALIAGVLLGWTASSFRTSDAMTADEIASAVDTALSQGSRLDRISSLAPLLKRLTPDNVELVHLAFRRRLSGLGECDIRPFMDAWTRFDAVRAFDEALTWRFLAKRQIGAEAAMHGWAIEEPLAAQEAFADLAESRPRLAEPLFEALVSGWVHSRQGGIQTYLRSLSSVPQSQGLGVAIGATLRARGFEELSDWSEEFIRGSEPLFQRKIFRKVLRSITRREPARGIEWLGEHSDKEYSVEGYRVVAEEWVQSEPEAAMEWVRTAVPSPYRAEALRFAYGRWLATQSGSALEWLERAPRTEFHDPAIRALALRFVRREPSKALGWCERSQDEGQRIACLTSVARKWYGKEPELAAAWLEGSVLDEDVRESIRGVPQDRRSPIQERGREGSAQGNS